jgi:hypothetical protein
MNKPRAIGLIEGTIDGLTNIDRWGAVEVSQWINIKGCVKNLQEAIKLLESDKKKTCWWEYNELEDYNWTACKDEFILSNQYLIKENKIKYCPYCGGEIVETKGK